MCHIETQGERTAFPNSSQDVGHGLWSFRSCQVEAHRTVECCGCILECLFGYHGTVSPARPRQGWQHLVVQCFTDAATRRELGTAQRRFHLGCEVLVIDPVCLASLDHELEHDRSHDEGHGELQNGAVDRGGCGNR